MSAQRQRKEHIVSALSERFKQAQIILVAHYDGSSMEDLTALRGELVPYGGVFHITKNKLALLALKGSEAEFLSPLFSGPTAIAFANDEAQITHISKALVDFGKNCEHIRIIGGAFAGQLIDENGVKNLANLPSLDGVRAAPLDWASPSPSDQACHFM